VVRGKGAPGGLVVGEGGVDYTTHYNDTFTDKFGLEEQHRVTKDEIVKMRL